MTYWQSQQSDGSYSLQFETDSLEKYKALEAVAQKMVDTKDFISVDTSDEVITIHAK